MNSINEDFLNEMPKSLNAVEKNKDLRALVIKSTGKAFCVGLDINLLTKAFKDEKYFSSVLKRLREIFLQIENLTLPVIAVVDGVVRAGGFELMLSTDIIYASTNSKIGDVHTNYSVPPGGGSTARLPKIVGTKVAKELIMTAKWLDSMEAEKLGIINRSIKKENLDIEVKKLINALIDKPRSIHEIVKKMISSSYELNIEEGTKNEITLFKNYVFKGKDAKEGFNSYIENRDPSWKDSKNN